MPVNRSFKALLEKIEPLPSEIAQAQSHAAVVKTHLAVAFDLRKFSLIGSYARGTAICAYGDADYFAVLPTDDCRDGDEFINSKTLVGRVADHLRGRFEQSEVTIGGRAVAVPFDNGGRAVDVVPGFFSGYDQARRPLYQIPDGSGGWRPTSPESHNRFIQEANEECRFRLQHTAKLIKYWRECRTPRVALSSFHMELLLAGERTCTRTKNYTQCLADAFQLLAQRQCRACKDPLGISGDVPAVGTEDERLAALDAVEYARDHAKSAVDAENHLVPGEASRQWDMVFNGEFPY